jgi:hypothetical protein
MINELLINNLDTKPHKDENEDELTRIELDEFKNKVQLWIKTDDEIRALQKAIKERKGSNKDLSNEILDFMMSHNIENLNTKDGSKLKYSVSYNRKPISKKVIKSRLMNWFKDTHKSNECITYVLDNNEKEKKIGLKRLLKK